MGFTYTLVRGKPKVLGEVGLMFTVYNLVRCASILNPQKLITALKQSVCNVFKSNYSSFCTNLRNLVFLTYKIKAEINSLCRAQIA